MKTGYVLENLGQYLNRIKLRTLPMLCRRNPYRPGPSNSGMGSTIVVDAFNSQDRSTFYIKIWIIPFFEMHFLPGFIHPNPDVHSRAKSEADEKRNRCNKVPNNHRLYYGNISVGNFTRLSNIGVERDLFINPMKTEVSS